MMASTVLPASGNHARLEPVVEEYLIPLTLTLSHPGEGVAE